VEIHEKYMHRCLQLAAMGIRKTAPNPMVGAVIVHNNRIIGEGFHQYFGGPHAEIEAIKSVIDPTLLNESTLYVNLEPCNHTGKTPPCTDAILACKIQEVVIAHADPFAAVNGAGIERLKKNGIKVTAGILEKEARFLNRRFLTFHTKQRPYIILKWAMSADGFMGIPGENIRISNEATAVLTHQWRSEEQTILVGSGTVITDDPQLNTRLWPGENPLRIILDQRGSLPSQRNIFDGKQSTIVFSGNSDNNYPNAQVIHIQNDSGFLSKVLNELYKRSVQSILVEGGAATLKLFIKEGLWDEIRVFQSVNNISEGIKAPDLPEGKTEETSIENNTLKIIYNH
jgi:diaminohydroxyphosphoribosylaminopyrimidine deaminase/5-amino-6-(5-phosphoribosylamino)uracil reductase